jgi:myo-inositol-1-phosphate synthase
MVDVIRAMKVALENKESGDLEEISSLMFKSPKKQVKDDIAMKLVRDKYKLG